MSKKTFIHVCPSFRILFVSAFLSVFFTIKGQQPPVSYYSSAENLNGSNLKNALHGIIKNHNAVSYTSLWDHFQATDKRSDNSKVWDIYSDNPSGNTYYYYTFGTDQCGSYSSEGDCYNREHSVPKSWFGGSVAPMYTDLFHLYPTDGFVNAKRSNLPFGIVSSATWTSSNGSKIGSCGYEGYSDQVFEPIDSFKGDLARTIFYMAVCYQNKNLAVETQSMFSYSNGMSSIKPWAKKMLLEWCALDPVSAKEINRNNAIYQIQHNRNPFIDFPDLADKVFGSDTNCMFTTGVEVYKLSSHWRAYPNPTIGLITVFDEMNRYHDNAYITITDVVGKVIIATKSSFHENFCIDLSGIGTGLYFMQINSNDESSTIKIIKQ